MFKGYLIISVVLLASCSAQKTKTGTGKIGPKNAPIYVDFINEIPELKVPTELTCGFEKIILTESQAENLRPITPAGYEIFGKLLINPDYNILIVCELIEGRYYPYVFVTDKNGIDQSTQKLFEKTCNSDSTVQVQYKISTNDARQIIVVESVIVKSEKNAVKSESTTIFEINKKGKVVKI